MKPHLITLILLAGAVIQAKASEKKVSLGLLKIFDHFLKLTDLVGSMPPVLQTLAQDLVHDIRRLIPEVEKIAAKYNATEPILQEVGNAMNITRVTHEYLPELEKILEDENLLETIKEIIGYVNLDRVKYELLPQLDKLLKENNVSQILDEIKVFLNVTVIADILLPEIQRLLEGEDVAKIIEEVEKIVDMTDISGKLIPNLEKIFESHNVSQIVHALDDLLNLTKLANDILPEFGKLLEELKVNDILLEVRKFLNMTHVHGLLDELEKIIYEADIVYHVPDLEPFLNISLIRTKLDEVEKLLYYFDVHGIIDEIEKHLDVDHLISKVPEFDEFLEDLGLSKLLRDINELIEMSFLSGPVSDIKDFILSANLTHKINDLEKLLNVSYLRDVIVPEIERMVEESNIDGLYDEARQFLNTTFLIENVIPEIEKIWYDLGVDDQLELLLSLTNMTFLRELMEGFDRQWNITLRGEQIKDGDLAGVVNGMLDELFANEKIDVPATTQPTEEPTDTGTTEAPTLPPVCDQDCDGVPCGDAITNICGECVLGETGKEANHGMDCNNECSGTARVDSCGYCSKPTHDDRTSAFADCNNDCDGSAVNDSCGNCAGGKTGKGIDYAKDACGICGGDNSSCVGCDGVPNSGKIRDSCGVCGGDGSSCTAISTITPSLLPTTSASGRVVTVLGAGLNGDAIKCVLDGEESQGTVINNTHCQCTIPSGKTAGDKTFTVKVRKNNQDVATDDLTLTLYDSTTTKITTLTPSEVLTEQETYLTFGGDGFVNSDSAVCIVTAGEKKMYLPASYQSGSFTRKLPAYKTSQSITLALSLNGIHELASDVALSRTVYAVAPVVTRSEFTAAGALINIAFDKPISTSSLRECADIFSTGVSSLGSSSGCSWSDPRHLVITPGVDATVEPTNSLTFKSGSVKQDETYSKAITGFVIITAPSNPVKPVPVILGPTQISSCGHLALDGSQSSGGGGRNLEYVWSLEGQVNADITAVLDAAEDNDRVFINGTLMASGSTYTFKLAVKNFIYSTAMSSTITVTKASQPLPEVTVDGPLDGKVFGMNSFYITAIATAASCSSSTALTFAWSVKCTQGDSADAAEARVEASSGYLETSTKFALKIDSGALLAGRTYEFTVVVALKESPSIKTTVKTSVVVEWSPLQPGIVGGDRTVGRDGGKLTLDAKSSTVDPDQDSREFFCSWTCVDKSNDQPCYSFVKKQQKIDFANNCVLEIDSLHFEADKSYLITSQVSKGSRSAKSSIVLTVVAGKPPVVTILAPTLHVVANARVPLKATYVSSVRPVKVEWFCEQGDEYRFIDLSDASLFASSFEQYKIGDKSISEKVIKPNVLTPGASYMFTLRVDDGSKVGTSTMVVTVRSGPTSGDFEVEPTTLKQLQDVTLRAPRWVTDSDAYPITYEFGFLDHRNVFQLLTSGTSNVYTNTVPPGYGAKNILTLRVRVEDSFGSVKWLDKNITVNEPTNIDADKLENLMQKGLKIIKDTGDFSKIVPKMRSILKTVNGNNKVSKQLAKKVADSTVTSLLLAVKSTSLDGAKAKPIFNTFLDVQPTYIDDSSEVLDGFDKVVKASVKSLDKDTIEQTLGWLGEVSAKADHKNDAMVSQDIINSYESLADGLLNDVNLGQAAVVTSSANPSVEIKVAHSLLDDAVTAGNSSSPTELEFGSEMAAMCGQRECSPGKMCLGCQVKIITYKEDFFNDQSPDKPNILPDKIVSVAINNPETGEEQTISGLKEPFKLNFKTGVPGSAQTFRCFYYNEVKQKWSNDGITSIVIGGVLQCFSTHLTSFSPADVRDNNTQPDKTYRVSFVLSNTTWNEKYKDDSNSDTVDLKNDILTEITAVYSSDSTIKSVQLESLQNSNGKVKVVLNMVFSGSNTDPASRLRSSMADGMLGKLAVDPSSLEFVNVEVPSEQDENDITLILGLVVGTSLLVVLIVLFIVYLVYRNKKATKVKAMRFESAKRHPKSHVNPVMSKDHAMTPV